MNAKTLTNKFKKHFLNVTNLKLDFRMHKYLTNNYELSPTFDYYFAKDIVKELSFYISEMGGAIKRFNLDHELEKLRICSLKHYIECEFEMWCALNNPQELNK